MVLAEDAAADVDVEDSEVDMAVEELAMEDVVEVVEDVVEVVEDVVMEESVVMKVHVEAELAADLDVVKMAILMDAAMICTIIAIIKMY